MTDRLVKPAIAPLQFFTPPSNAESQIGDAIRKAVTSSRGGKRGSCAQRWALLLPQSGSVAGSFCRSLVDVFSQRSQLPLQDTGEKNYNPGDSLHSNDFWSVRLLHKTLHNGSGASIVEVQPRRDTAEIGEMERQLLAIGPASTILHVLASPLEIDEDAGFSIERQDIKWEEEAQRAISAARALSVGSRPPPLVILFAIHRPGSSNLSSACNLALSVVKELTISVKDRLARAMKTILHGSGDCRKVAPMPEVVAFCVALNSANSGCAVLPGCLVDALAWSARHNSAWDSVPACQDLELSQRLLVQWKAVLLEGTGGLVMPRDIREAERSFEVAVDACASELSRLLTELPAQPMEWLDPATSVHARVEAAQHKLWYLVPPWELLFAEPDVTACWQAARNWLSDSIGVVLAPRPAWWDIPESRDWISEKISKQIRLSTCVVSHTPPMLVGRLAISTDVTPASARRIEEKDASNAMVEAPTSAAASTGVKRKESAPTTQQRWGALNCLASRPDAAPQTVQKEQVSKKRPKSFLDVLQKDSEWTERLLRGVALLASDVPV